METIEPGSSQRPPGPDDQPEDFRSILEELRALVSTFADASPEGMTPHFYVHAFNEYDVSGLCSKLCRTVSWRDQDQGQSRWLGC